MQDNPDNSNHNPDVKLHLWLEENSGVYFGKGRYEILALIDELGSLKLAAEKLGMSYRGAWGKIKKTEEIIGRKLITKEANKEGYKLTAFGTRFINEFRNFQQEVLDFAKGKATEMLERLQEHEQEQKKE